MEKDEKGQIAFLSAYENTNQCELAFELNTSLYGSAFCEHVKAVRQVTDTVGSLVKHIQNKLNKVIKTKFEEADEKVIEVPLWLEDNGSKIEGNIVLKDLIRSKKVNELHILDQKFKVEVGVKAAVPSVRLISLPVIIYANTVVQPTRFIYSCANKDLCVFKWYRSANKEEWTEVGVGFNYRAKKFDLGQYLKLQCIPKSENRSGPAYEVISESMVTTMPPLPICPFEERHIHTPSKLTDKEFRVVSYNTLSTRYSETNLQFPYCSNEFLSIDYRKHLLLKEIRGYKADVICLQEVDSKEYFHFFNSKFKRDNYDSIFHRKGNKISEGLCCIYNSKKFKAVYSKQLVYCEELKKNQVFKHIKQAIKYGPDIEDIFFKVQTSLQVTVLQSRLLNHRLIVANTHLYYHPDANHIRVIQVAMALAFINHLRTELQQTKGKISVVFCGDFNSVPSSTVYHFLSTGSLKNLNEDCLRVIENIDAFTHPFQLESACGTPEYTNFTADFKGCLDYIFYDKQNTKLLRFVPFFDENVLSKHVALPNQMFPSDHLALVADLRLL